MNVSLQRIHQDNWRECIQLEVRDDQSRFIAPNVQSLAEACADRTFIPLAIYPESCRGPEQGPMVGFIMLEVKGDGIGFIQRMMIDRNHQRQGYGRAAMIEAIRRLRLNPDVERIATSHRHDNEAAASFYRGLGFVEWRGDWTDAVEGEVFLILDEESRKSGPR